MNVTKPIPFTHRDTYRTGVHPPCSAPSFQILSVLGWALQIEGLKFFRLSDNPPLSAQFTPRSEARWQKTLELQEARKRIEEQHKRSPSRVHSPSLRVSTPPTDRALNPLTGRIRPPVMRPRFLPLRPRALPRPIWTPGWMDGCRHRGRSQFVRRKRNTSADRRRKLDKDLNRFMKTTDTTREF